MGLQDHGAALRDLKAFTLIEIIVVVAIIAMLAGLLAPVVQTIRENAKRKYAAVQAQTLAHAVKKYRNVYGKWPGQTQGVSDITYSNLNDIISALVSNERGVVFLEYPEDSFVNDCHYMDPWNRPYFLAMDEDDDGDVTVSNSTNFFGTTTTTNIIVIGETAAVASWGPDIKNEKKRIVSW